MSLVSIVMPVYNGADYLDRALESLSQQTFSDISIIISDNASTDATPDIISKWQARDPRITYHRQRENIGAIANFKWVLAQAKSPWVMFASHDDLWSDNYVEVLYKVIATHPGTKLAVGMTTLVRPDGTHDPRPFYDRINKMKGLRRIRYSLEHVHGECLYGLFEREAIVDAFEKSMEHEHVWGSSGIMILPFSLSGSVAGNNAAVYYKTVTELSNVRYKPKSPAEQFSLCYSFFIVSTRILWRSQRSYAEKLILSPLMAVYTNRRAWRLSRLVRDSLLFAFKPKKFKTK